MRWRDEYSEYVGWVLIFAAGAMTAGSFMSWGSKSFWDVATAIGTVSAAVGAVWIAVEQRVKDQKAREKRAVLLGAALYGRIADLVHICTKVSNFANRLEVDGKYDGWMTELNELAKEIDAYSNISHEDVASLVDLPDHGAFRLAEALGAIHQMKFTLQRAKLHIEVNGEGAPNDQMLSGVLLPFAQVAWIGFTRVQRIVDSARPPAERMPEL